MKKYKPLVITSLLAAIVMTTPAISFAENNNQNGNDNQAKKVDSSLLNRFFKLFNNHASAETNNLGPVVNGITAPTVLKVGEVGTWTVKASDPQNGSLSYSVNWDDASIMPMSQKSKLAIVQSSTFTHNYANKGNYKVTFIVSNNAGLTTTSTVTVHVYEVDQIVNAPVISNLTATSLRTNRATINWVTDVRSTSKIWYSKTTPVDTSVKENISQKNRVLKHKIELKKLEQNTKYYVVVKSTNSAGVTISSEISFVTLATTDNNTPVISSITGPTTVVVGGTATETVKVFDQRNSSLSYSVDWGDADTSTKSIATLARPIFVQSATFSHVYNSVGIYNATFTVENSAGKKVSSSIKISVTPASVDVATPVISMIETRTGNSSSTISWTTNELATSQIFYSKITPLDVNSASTVSIVDNAFATKHSLNIPGLAKSTLYHFIIKSTDAANNTAISSESAFMTNSEM